MYIQINSYYHKIFLSYLSFLFLDTPLEKHRNWFSQVISTINRPNIRFTLYIAKNSSCNYVAESMKVYHFDHCFVINELRDLAIETIETTHFMVIDGDGILSS